MAVNSDRYLTIADVAERFAVTDKTVRRWLEAGRLPGAFRTPGGQWRLPADAIDALAEPADPTDEPTEASS